MHAEAVISTGPPIVSASLVDDVNKHGGAVKEIEEVQEEVQVQEQEQEKDSYDGPRDAEGRPHGHGSMEYAPNDADFVSLRVYLYII